MIRRFLTPLVLVVAAVLLAATHVSAQSSLPMTNEHIQRIKDSCQQANRTLRQLHASDALLRVNRGQLYDLLSTKLMARMNSRLALNRLDASDLVMVTANFDRTLGEFRTRYQAYEEQLSATIKINCREKPTGFYNAVQESRELRGKVHESVRKLTEYIVEYDQKFKEFRSHYASPKPGDES